MNVDAFDSKQRFKDLLRIAYDSGTFLLGMKVSSFIVLAYYTYLKEDYEKNEMARQYFKPECMGYQSDNYWIISDDVRYILLQYGCLPQITINRYMINFIGEHICRSLKREKTMWKKAMIE
jgi:hypothetical protein